MVWYVDVVRSRQFTTVGGTCVDSSKKVITKVLYTTRLLVLSQDYPPDLAMSFL